MRYLEDLEKVDWRALGDEDLELPELIGEYIRHQDGRALGLIFWGHVLPDSEFLTQSTSHVVEFLVPLLEEEGRGDEAAIIFELAQTCWAAMESRNFYYGPDCDPAEWSFSTLQAIAEGFDALVRIFNSRPDLHLPLAYILSCFPERASRYLPQILSRYDACQEQFEKCELLICLDQLAARIPGWNEILLTAIADNGVPVLQHFAACLLVAHYGSDAPGHCLSLLAKASPDEVPPYMFLQNAEIPYTEVLVRALRALAPEDRISIIVSILARVKETTTAHRLVAYLLEAASMQPRLRLGRQLGSGEFLPLDDAAAWPLKVDPRAPDWIPAIVHCQPFWKDTIELLSLFVLPTTQDGLVDLWQSVHQKPFPKAVAG